MRQPLRGVRQTGLFPAICDRCIKIQRAATIKSHLVTGCYNNSNDRIEFPNKFARRTEWGKKKGPGGCRTPV